MWNLKTAMATFHTCQCQDGGNVLKCYEWNIHGIKKKCFRKPKHTKKHKKDSIGYFVKKILKNTNLSQNCKL